LTKDVTFIKDGKKYRASWMYIVNLYELDKKNELLELRALPKLTDMHIYADKMKKMKVSSAAQIFSQRVAATMKLMCNHGKFTNPLYMYHIILLFFFIIMAHNKKPQ